MPRKAHTEIPQITQGETLSNLQVECVPVDDRSLLEVVKSADIILYVATGCDVDHPVLLDFRALVTELNPWDGNAVGDNNRACSALAAKRRSILLSLGLAICAGCTLTLHRGKPRRVLAICYASPQTRSVRVSLRQEALGPVQLH